MPRTMSRSLFEQIERMLVEFPGKYKDIGKELGIAASTVRKIALGQHYFQTGITSSTRKEAYLPTPEEIEAACDRIRQASEPQFAEWTVPVCSVVEI